MSQVRDESMELIQNYISGDYVTPRSIDRLNLYNPATGEVYGELVDSNSEDIQDAVSSAKDAFASWSGLSFSERADYIMAIADEIDAQSDTFSELESRDTGKPLSLARSLDIPDQYIILNFLLNTLKISNLKGNFRMMFPSIIFRECHLV